jgi:lipoyl(octanoyl) transferase
MPRIPQGFVLEHIMNDAIEWRIGDQTVAYDDAVGEMERRVALIRSGDAPELIWLLEHPPLYSAGSSARAEDLLEPDRFPVHAAGRGGEYTYHGPGQRVAYVMLDLNRRGRDVRLFVRNLEQWMIETLAAFGVAGERREGRVGIWVEQEEQERKIAAIGVRLRHWISFHGVSLNVAPDLTHYGGIVPCGISEHGVTSLADMGIAASMEQVDDALKNAFYQVFEDESP